jgi:hypothetical protein
MTTVITNVLLQDQENKKQNRISPDLLLTLEYTDTALFFRHEDRDLFDTQRFQKISICRSRVDRSAFQTGKIKYTDIINWLKVHRAGIQGFQNPDDIFVMKAVGGKKEIELRTRSNERLFYWCFPILGFWSYPDKCLKIKRLVEYFTKLSKFINSLFD